MANELTIAPGFLRSMLFKMRAVALGDEDTPRDARDNVHGPSVQGAHHTTLNEEVGVGASHEELVEEIDGLYPEHRYELVALMWIGRGDFAAEEWRDALALTAERADTPTSHYLLSHPMTADYIASGLEEMGYDHILENGMY